MSAELLPTDLSHSAAGAARFDWPRATWLVLSWAIPLAFLAWALRLAILEGYVFASRTDFLGSDFTRTAALGSPEWWTGSGIFYGPIFVLEYRFLLHPGGIATNAEFAILDFLLFILAFAAAWLALFGTTKPRLALLILGAWFAHHAAVEAFSNTAHLEVLELALICSALLLVVRDRSVASGGMLGLAIATKTLPAMFLPYLLIARKWRLLVAAIAAAGFVFLAVCWLQQITPWDGAYALIYQGGNLSKLEFTEYEYSPRADVARILAGTAGMLTPEQGRIAIGVHVVLAVLAVIGAALVVARAAPSKRAYGLLFGLVGTVMLVVSPSAHIQYYIFLLPAWTAMLAVLLSQPLTRFSGALWVALVAGYVFTGFDQPFFALQRVLGVGLVVPQHWLTWHLPTLALFVTYGAVCAMLLRSGDRADRAVR